MYIEKGSKNIDFVRLCGYNISIMKSYFDIIQLENLLKDYYYVTQIRITILDVNFVEIGGYPKERAKFCQYIRNNSECDKQCIICDKTACKIASTKKSPYIYKCHAGLTEIIYPLLVGDVTIGYLFFAHIFSFENYEKGIAYVIKRLEKYQLDKNIISTHLQSMPNKSKEYINAAANMLQAVAYYLCIQRFAYLKQEDLPIRIDNYIKENLKNNLSAQAICDEFSIGKTSLYSIANQLYSKGLATYIRDLRINLAKDLLQSSPNMPISDIAEQCGFLDYNYFIALFRKIVGVSPKKYAMQNSSNKNNSQK